MKRPVWLFSLDTEQFAAPPMTTGALKAFFLQRGRSAGHTEVELVHFASTLDVQPWLRDHWDALHVHQARQAALRGLSPVVAFSFYTWNAADFLEAIAHIRASCPEITVVAGGPHIQRAADYVGREGIDLVVLGEGEETFQQWLDCERRDQWSDVAGLVFLGDDGELVQTPERPRCTDLDSLPSALDVLELRDDGGKPLFKSVAYETSRGCPFRCAYCEWGTGAIGTKMHQFSLERIRSDFERLIEGGIEDIWLADSNFGALREDLDKARLAVELRQRTGLPRTLATSWSKNHTTRVQDIVLLLKEHGLLSHYNLALQTLTPLALQLSNRKNMRSNKYEPVAKAMAEQGVPIATELIWGLPGDNLADFERNLDRLETVFPNINIFGYTLLPGTEFYDRREEYRIETIPVAGYGKARGEYVVGCHTFDRDEGLEGYFLITAHIILIRGHVVPLSSRLIALDGRVPSSPLLRAVLRALVAGIGGDVPGLDPADRMSVYEHRAALYLAMLRRHDETFQIIGEAVRSWLLEHGADPELMEQVGKVLELDEAFCPRVGPSRAITRHLGFAAEAVERALGRMERPEPGLFANAGELLRIDHPAHVGEVLKDPDGGSWMRGRIVSEPVPRSSAQSPGPAAEMAELA
ncbi:MAG: radical SAM protein [Myxococcales bacterium]